MRVPLLLAFVLFATTALAQFPPPGVYACFHADGAAFGELTLLVAGDYAFTAADGSAGSGQVASAGTDVNPLSGPLHALGLTGAFGTDEAGRTLFRFTGRDGLVVTCD